MYAWVPWFRQLSARIADGGEQGLIERAKEVDWKQEKPTLLRFGHDNIDPLSFLYFLSSRLEALESVGSVFNLKDLPTEEDWALTFPQAIAVNAHFLSDKHSNPSVLWCLFRQAQPTKPTVDSEVFRAALDIKGVGLASLTQALCLANAEAFLPVDGTIEPVRRLRPVEKGKFSLSDYFAIMNEARTVVPACNLYEIARFLYEQWRSGGELVGEQSKSFHISTNVFDDERDLWFEFEESNSVRVGGPGRKTQYPLTEPDRGDIVLVRHGFKGRGIGVVLENEYRAAGGFSEEARIHVLWVNKTEAPLEGQTRRYGLGSAKPESQSFSAFARTAAYKPTLGLLKEMGVPMPEPEESNANMSKTDFSALSYPLNQILFGPPGTGKTWSTVERAVAIIDGPEAVAKDRAEVREQFESHRKAGRVEMVTFHQNYAYEDFIEGIRPVLGGEDEAGLGYELSPGVFRDIAGRALENLRASKGKGASLPDVRILVDRFLESIEERLGLGESLPLNDPPNDIPAFIEGVYRGRDGEAKGIRVGGNERKKTIRLHRRVLERDYRDFHEGRITCWKHIRPVGRSRWGRHAWARFFYPVLAMMKKHHESGSESGVAVERRNHVLIIDEINRGNIARIFGELITLVEKSRRIGGDDETRVRLPYSGDEFGVPKNLYLIGTMNTADRSIALLDTALRRRFEFEEMMPDANHPKMSTNIEGVNLPRLLKDMNKRIRFLRDREHQIGHTYFLGVSDLKGLKRAFQKEILPLLQEYFYDDWAKIVAVLRNNGFVRPVKRAEDLSTDLVDSDAKAFDVLEFENPKWNDPSRYQSIYDEKAAGTENAEGAEADDAGD